MRKILTGVAVVALTVTMLAGCGGDDDPPGGSGGYCDDLQQAKDDFTGLLDNQIGQDTFVELRDALPELQAEAPAAIQDDWTTFNNAIQEFSDAMDKAGLTMDDMRDMGTGEMGGGED